MVPVGDVVAVGDGKVGEITQTFDLKVGDTILYSKFGIGATDITVQGDPHILIREDDVIGTMPRSGATAEDIPNLQPVADRVLIKVCVLFSALHTSAASLPAAFLPAVTTLHETYEYSIAFLRQKPVLQRCLTFVRASIRQRIFREPQT